MMVAVPADTAVTVAVPPVALTVATDGSEDAQKISGITSDPAVSVGVADTVAVAPSRSCDGPS